jgi:glycosyltransferase involved in cell wall biosynthesis
VVRGVVALIPAYQAADTVGWVVREVAPFVDEVIVVDDGSCDGTGERASEHGGTVVRHASNMGKGAALRTGFAACCEKGFAWILTLDADGQHDPSEAPGFLERAAVGRWHIVVGSRMGAPGAMPWLRVATNRATSFVVSCLAGRLIPDSQSGYRLISTDVVRRVPLRCTAYDLETEILVRAARAGYGVGWVPITSTYAESRSFIHPVRDTARFAALVLRLAVGACAI